MLIIADYRIPNEAKINLQKIGHVLWLKNENKAYPAISCHPDIFFCQVGNELITAKNTSKKIIEQIKTFDIKLTIGTLEVGQKYPESTYYNAVITNDFLIRNTKIPNPIFDTFQNNRKTIHVSQGYTRCNLIHVKNNAFITSDQGIYNGLIKNNLEVLYVNPKEIILETMNHGFFGGCCGVYEDTFYLVGSLKHHSQGYSIKKFVENFHLNIVELCQGKLWDCGGLLFLNNNI